MTRNIWLVARREYLADVRTRSFLLGVLLTPLLIAVSIWVQDLMENAAKKAGKPFVIVDLSLAPAATPGVAQGGHLGERLAGRWQLGSRWALERVHRPVDTAEGAEALIASLAERARDGELEGFAVLRGDLVAGGGRMQWYTRNIDNDDLKLQVANALRDLVLEDGYVWHGVSGATLAAIQAS